MAENKKKRQDKQRARHVGELTDIETGNASALKGQQDDQSIPKDVVVERAQKLGREKGREAPL